MSKPTRIRDRLPSFLVFVLAACLFAIACSSALTSCNTEDVMTPGERERAVQLDFDLKTLEGRARAAEQLAREAAAEMGRAENSGDAAIAAAAIKKFGDARQRWLDEIQAFQAKQTELDELVTGAQRRAAEPVTAGASLVWPWLGPAIPILTNIVLPLFFTRPRRLMADGVKAAAAGKPLVAGENIAKAWGWLHAR